MFRNLFLILIAISFSMPSFARFDYNNPKQKQITSLEDMKNYLDLTNLYNSDSRGNGMGHFVMLKDYDVFGDGSVLSDAFAYHFKHALYQRQQIHNSATEFSNLMPTVLGTSRQGEYTCIMPSNESLEFADLVSVPKGEGGTAHIDITKMSTGVFQNSITTAQEAKAALEELTRGYRYTFMQGIDGVVSDTIGPFDKNRDRTWDENGDGKVEFFLGTDTNGNGVIDANEITGFGPDYPLPDGIDDTPYNDTAVYSCMIQDPNGQNPPTHDFSVHDVNGVWSPIWSKAVQTGAVQGAETYAEWDNQADVGVTKADRVYIRGVRFSRLQNPSVWGGMIHNWEKLLELYVMAGIMTQAEADAEAKLAVGDTPAAGTPPPQKMVDEIKAKIEEAKPFTLAECKLDSSVNYTTNFRPNTNLETITVVIEQTKYLKAGMANNNNNVDNVEVACPRLLYNWADGSVDRYDYCDTRNMNNGMKANVIFDSKTSTNVKSLSVTLSRNPDPLFLTEDTNSLLSGAVNGYFDTFDRSQNPAVDTPLPGSCTYSDLSGF